MRRSILLVLWVVGSACARTGVVRPGPVVAAPRGSSVPAGTLVAAQLRQEISTDRSRPGDRVTLELLDPLVAADGREQVARGALVDGLVHAVKPSPFALQTARLELSVTALHERGRTSRPVSWELVERPSEMSSGRLASLWAGLGGLAAGAAVGLVVDSSQGGVVWGSALVGAGLGALAGTLLGTRQALLPAGSVVTLRLSENLPEELAGPVDPAEPCVRAVR